MASGLLLDKHSEKVWTSCPPRHVGSSIRVSTYTFTTFLSCGVARKLYQVTNFSQVLRDIVPSTACWKLNSHVPYSLVLQNETTLNRYSIAHQIRPPYRQHCSGSSCYCAQHFMMELNLFYSLLFLTYGMVLCSCVGF